jgi:hypothetical protein
MITLSRKEHVDYLTAWGPKGNSTISRKWETLNVVIHLISVTSVW